MAEKKVNEGSVADFIKNFRKMYAAFRGDYGLDPNEKAALHDSHMSSANNAVDGVIGGTLLGGAVGNLESSIGNPRLFTTSADVAGIPAFMALGGLQGLMDSARVTSDKAKKKAPYRIGKEGANDTRTYEQQVRDANAKVNYYGGIPAAGTFNEQLNSSFLTNLRKNRK